MPTSWPNSPLPHNPPSPWKLAGILGIGILAVSTAAPLVRLAMTAADRRGPGFSLVLAGARLAIAAIVLLPTWPQVWRTAPTTAGWKYAIAAGAVLACHFAIWITSLSYTSIAASTALVTTNPVWVTLLSWFWFGERPTRRTLLGIAIALIGGLLVGLSSATGGPAGSQPLLGNLLALLGAWAVSSYFLLGRSAQRRGLSIGAYATIAYSVAALILLPLPWFVGAGYTGFPASVYGYILLTAIVPQLIGHTSFNWAVCWMSPTLVTLIILFEPVFASVLGYLLFQEVPSVTVGLGAIILLMGVAIAAIG